MILKIAKAFAYRHGIKLNERRNGLIGRRERLVLGYWDNSLRQKIFVNKSFPPLEGVYESRVNIDDDGQNSALKIKILYGCLEDYVAQLHEVKGDLCKVVQRLLIDSYFDLSKNPQLPENVLQHQLPIDISGHSLDLHELLKSFYPSILKD